MNSSCTMREHGRADAPAACCRPDSASFHSPAASNVGGHGSVWRQSARNTLICLLGCTIGDVGVVVASWIWFPHAPMLLVMALAIVAGLITSIALETFWRVRQGHPVRQAFSMALSMSFVSMLAMEIAMNLVDLGLTGGHRAHLSIETYAGVLALGEIAGFLVPWPYNAWRLSHGRSCH